MLIYLDKKFFTSDLINYFCRLGFEKKYIHNIILLQDILEKILRNVNRNEKKFFYKQINEQKINELAHSLKDLPLEEVKNIYYDSIKSSAKSSVIVAPIFNEKLILINKDSYDRFINFLNNPNDRKHSILSNILDRIPKYGYLYNNPN